MFPLPEPMQLFPDIIWDRFAVSSLLLAALTGVLLCKFVVSEYLTPLAKLPGFRPSWLSIWVLDFGTLLRPESGLYGRLHQRYGPIVRIGPRIVSIADPNMVRAVYTSYRFPKGVNYRPFSILGDNIFSTQDNSLHRKLKKLIAPAYSQGAVASMEPLIQEVGVTRLLDLLRKHADAEEPVDLLCALQLMTFDVIGEIAFGRSFAMLETGTVHPIIEWIDDTTSLSVKHILGPLFMPFMFRKKTESLHQLISFARDAVRTRREQKNTARQDTLQRLLEAVDEETGDRLTEDQLISEAIVQM
ncbi:cytochrome P450 [Thamnocephalis sphaerospora]|uniref:Cytochrome P450 n=1 Tax=Thamnocephalis sphaerospora TaxID=78915 RepID=A0A4P9XG67_9FUNG|nr:cytochrome P450 [Thamnocephalis sphaerospora]|eukprot:RKP04625.1 cytochrome P450 [Thamnocephalis sphaerospora]